MKVWWKNVKMWKVWWKCEKSGEKMGKFGENGKSLVKTYSMSITQVLLKEFCKITSENSDFYSYSLFVLEMWKSKGCSSKCSNTAIHVVLCVVFLNSLNSLFSRYTHIKALSCEKAWNEMCMNV